MQNESRWDTGADPMTYVSPFDPFVQGALTTGENFSAASGLTSQVGSPDGVIHKRHHQPMFSPGANPPRPVASSTQRKVIVKGNKNLSQGGRETKDKVPRTPRTIQRQSLAEAISKAMSKGL